VLVSALAVNNSARIDSKIPPEVIAAIAEVDGVARMDTIRFSAVEHPDISLALVATNGDGPNFNILRGDDRPTSFAAGRVMIGPALARTRGLGPGDTFVVPGVEGPVELTVGGVWSSSEDLGTSLHVSDEQFAAIAGERPASYHIAVPEPGVTAEELAGRIRAVGAHDRLLVLPPQEFGDELAREIQKFVDPFVALQRAMLIVGFVATGATLLLAAVQRKRELATLAAVGMPPAELARVTLAEAGVLGLVATVVGSAAGFVGYAGFVFLSQSITGLPLVWVVPWAVLPLVLVSVVAVALGGAAWPAWRSTRIDPAIALRYE
jgi:putative ABC transport system permease protein